MKLFNDFKRLGRPYDEEEDEYEDDDYEEEEERGEESAERRGVRNFFSSKDREREEPKPTRSAPARPVEERQERRPFGGSANKVVNFSSAAQSQIVMVKPSLFDEAAEIADHLRDRRTVVLNLETTDQGVSRRLVDFLSGVAYANEGQIKKAAASTFIITPSNVDIQGVIFEELENSSSLF